MSEKNLFNAVKTFINNTPVGQTFTTNQLIDNVGENETLTRWKDRNSNPFYRTHTYKAYLKRTGFLSTEKRGEWKVEKHIPESYNLGTIEFLIGYKGKIYNGMTREEILNQKPSLQKGDIVRFNNPSITYAANKWATAIYQGTTYIDQDGGELITVKWVRDGNDNGQFDGEYYSHMFAKVKEVSTQKEDRILSENKKDMKFDFESGKRQLMEWMDNEFDCCYGNSLQYIKELSTIADIQDEVESFRRFEESWVGKTAAVNRATTMREVFEALKDTAIEDDDNTIMEFFIQERN